MTWVAVAVGGAAAIGAGTSIYGGISASNAAKDASSSQQQGLWAGLQMQRGTTNQMLQYFDPFRQMGLQAGWGLTSQIYSPQQQIASGQMTLDSLNRKMKTLQQKHEGYKTGIGVPVLTGKYASEKRKPIWDQMIADNQAQMAELNDQIKQQQAMIDQAKVQAANPTSQADQLEKNPMFVAGSNVVGRRLAAQGLQGSQEAIRQEGTLAANVYQNQVANELGIYQPTVGQAGQMATNIMASGQNQAQTLGGIGQSQAQGIMNSNQAWMSGIQGATNAVTGAGSTMLNYSMYNNLINSMGSQNTGGTKTAGWDPVMGTGNPPSTPANNNAESLSALYKY